MLFQHWNIHQEMKSIAQAATELKLSGRRLRALCDEGRIVDAEKIGKTWVLPDKVVILPPQSKRQSEKCEETNNIPRSPKIGRERPPRKAQP